MFYTRKKIRKLWIFLVKKSEILGGFYLQKKKTPSTVKKLGIFLKKVVFADFAQIQINITFLAMGAGNWDEYMLYVSI